MPLVYGINGKLTSYPLVLKLSVGTDRTRESLDLLFTAQLGTK